MAAEVKHPADEIGKALARASGILAVISNCYDKQTQSFETGSHYAYESILAIETIVVNAAGALEKLYGDYDLTPISASAPQAVQSEVSVAAGARAVEEPAMPNGFMGRTLATQKIEAASLNSYLSSFGPPEQEPRVSDRAEQPFTFDSQLGRAPLPQRRAETYDELLEKLTTVAHSAAAFEHQPGFEEKLLPALEELRADILRLRSVA